MYRRILLSLFASLISAHADPQLTSWFTANSGQYARLYQTTAAQTAATKSTTWSRGAGTQSNPVYADVNEVAYSTSWVYIRSSGLASHMMGPWYLDAAKTQNFGNFPSNTASIYRIPRVPTIPTSKTLTPGGATGVMVNGVSLFDMRDTFSYSSTSSQDAMPTNTVTGDSVWNREAYANEAVTFDAALAHQAGNNYHYHAQPIALRYQLGDHVDYNSSTNVYTESATAVTQHSPILAWAADGLPVYGPYGYSTATNAGSGVRRMISGFVLRNGSSGTTNLTTTGRSTLPAWATRIQTVAFKNGPAVSTAYALGHYLEDYDYLGDHGYVQGTTYDLNEQNVRYCVTPEFPGGTYAYFTTINTDGTPAYPFTTGRQYYGSPTGGSTTISETVTTQFIGGANKPLTINTPNVSGTAITLTWSAVEGGTYSVDASPNQTTWTSKATGIVSSGISSSSAYTAVGTAGTEYGRVNRTAIATYDSNGQSTATTAQATTTSYTLGGNAAPTISTVASQSTLQNIATGAIAFTVGDQETAAASLTVSASSSNTTLVPNANLVFGGSGANRTVTITPATGQTGTTTISLNVYDGTNTTSTTFLLTVSVPNTAPTITSISAQSTTQNTATSAIAFTVGDAQTAAASLAVTGGSANTTLIPNANIIFSGSGANRSVIITPSAGQTGSAVITITVSDSALTASATFTLTVIPSVPTIASITSTPAAPTVTTPVTITAAVAPPSGRTITSVQLTYSTGASATNTVFNETMAAAATTAWAGTNTVYPWTVAFNGPPSTPFSQTAAANHTSGGTGNQFGMEVNSNPPDLTKATITTTNAINATSTSGYVEFYMATSNLSSPMGWDFQTSTDGTTWTTRSSELTGANHGYQVFPYTLASAERVSTLKLRFRFYGSGIAATHSLISLDDIKVVTTTGVAPVTVTMLDDGTHGDGAAGDGIYGVVLPTQTLNTTVSYTIAATDSAAVTTTSTSASYTVGTGAAAMTVTPASGLSPSGPAGGAFSPISTTYTIANTGTAAMSWTASNSASWLTLGATNGTLAAGANTTVTATINAAANGLVAGSYADTLVFTNSTNGAGNATRATSLTVLSTNANLSSVSLSTGTLSPIFSSNTLSYTARVSSTNSSITLAATAADGNATVRVNGQITIAGTNISLSTGANTINIEVTAQDGVTTKSYSLIITRQTAVETWRQTWYGTPSNTGNAANSADPYHTGIQNLAVIGFLGIDQNPAQARIGMLPQVQRASNTLFYSFTEPPGISGITYGAEWNSNLQSGSWSPVSDTGSGSVHIFSLPIGSDKKFLRLKVTAP